jgi:hypothetical protein
MCVLRNMKNQFTIVFAILFSSYFNVSGQVFADLGKDYSGTSAIDAASGKLISIDSKSYLINAETDNEVRIFGSETGVDSKYDDGSYGAKSSKYNYLQIGDGYIELALTENSNGKWISSLKVNGTSGSTTVNISSLPILFSDKYPFDESRVIGYDDKGVLPFARSGGSGYTLSALPDGCRSARIYKQVKLRQLQQGLYQVDPTGTIIIGQTAQTPRIGYLKVVLKKCPSQISSFIINGCEATIDQTSKLITMVLPYGTNLTNLTPAVTLIGEATSYTPTGMVDFTQDTVDYTISDAGATFIIAYKVAIRVAAVLDSVNSISVLTINGKQAIIDHAASTIYYEFPRFVNLESWPVIYSLHSNLASADFTSGSFHDFASGPLSLKVTAQSGAIKTYLVSAGISDKRTIALVMSDGSVSTSDSMMLTAFKNYYVDKLIALNTVPTNMALYYKDYDLIVLHSSISITNPIAIKMRELVGVKPILNFKAHLYQSTCWNWSSVQNAGSMPGINYCIQVPEPIHNHQLFNDVILSGNLLTCFSNPELVTSFNAVQYIEKFNGVNFTSTMKAAFHTLATMESYEDVIQMHELNLSNAAKYILIGFSNEGNSYSFFNQNAISIISNAADYLTDSNAFYDYTLNKPGDQIPNALDETNILNEVVSVTYYDLMGNRMVGPSKGLNIITVIYTDGSIATKKIVLR